MAHRSGSTSHPVGRGILATLLVAVGITILHGWMAQAGVRAPRPQVARSASPLPDYSTMSEQEKARYRNQLSNQTREYQMEAIQARDKALVERVGRSVRIPPVKAPAPLPRVATPQSQQARQAQQLRAREAERARLAGNTSGNTSNDQTKPPQPEGGPSPKPTGPTSFVEVTAYGWSPYGRTETLAGGAPIPMVQVNRALVGNLAPGATPLNPFVASSTGTSGSWAPTPSSTDPPPSSCDGGALQECCDKAAAGTILTPSATPRCCSPLSIPAGYFAHPRCQSDDTAICEGGKAPPRCCEYLAAGQPLGDTCCKQATIDMTWGPGYIPHSRCSSGSGSGFGATCDPAKYAPHCCDAAVAYDAGGGPASIPPDCCDVNRGRPLVVLPRPYCP